MKAESVIRKIIREELDFYFNKIIKEIRNIDSNQVDREIFQEQTKKREPVNQVDRKSLRKKFQGILGAVTEDMDVDDLDLEGNKFSSVLNEDVIGALQKSDKPAMIGLSNALTRNYSDLLKKMDSNR